MQPLETFHNFLWIKSQVYEVRISKSSAPTSFCLRRRRAFQFCSTEAVQVHRRRLRGQPGHVPPIIENLPCIYHFLPTFAPQYFGLPTQYFCQVYASDRDILCGCEFPYNALYKGCINVPTQLFKHQL